MVVNVANLGRKPYIPLSSHINIIMAEIGFLMAGRSFGTNPPAPVRHALGVLPVGLQPLPSRRSRIPPRILQGRLQTASQQERACGRPPGYHPRDDFIQHTKSIWSFATERASRVNHPAPFPVELPKRCIEMYSFTGDVVLDPFNGSGTTCVAAKMHGRRYLGVDLSEDYCTIAEERSAKRRPWTSTISWSNPP